MADHAFQTTITNPELAGATVADEAPPEQEERRAPDPKPADKHGWHWGTGRRKTAVARVRIRPAADGKGKGKVQVQITRKQFKDIDNYFTEPRDRVDAVAPLQLSSLMGDVDVFVRLNGGGPMGQSQAMRLGLARAIVGFEPSHFFALRDAGFLSRDARKVERKKYGQPGARRRFQFSKR
jgi:small subunit ribosomal protein S9